MMIRLFAAIPIPSDQAEPLLALQAGVEGARWRPREALHVTLRFFDAVAEPVADDLDAALAVIGGEAFDLTLKGVGSFGEGRDLHAIWAGVEENAALRHLAHRCEVAARHAGLKPNTRNYTPHVTLAYLRHPDEAEVAAWIQNWNLLHGDSFRVAGFGLYSSWQGAGGSIYRLERGYSLA